MYSLSFALLGAQWAADAFGITLRSHTGVPIKANVLSITDVDTLNTISLNATQTNQTTIVTDPISAAAQNALQIFQLITGTYIFNLLLVFDIPIVIVGGMVLIYTMLMIRAIVGYLRGI